METFPWYNSKYSGFGSARPLGHPKAYPYIADSVNLQLIPGEADFFHGAGKPCLSPLENQNGNLSVFSYLRDGRDVLQETRLKSILEANVMGGQTPKIPQFLYQSLHGEVNPIEDADRLVKEYCDNGGHVQYHQHTASNHAALGLTGTPDAIKWITKRFDGEEVPKYCSTDTVVTSLDTPLAVETLGDETVQNLLATLGAPVGPKSLKDKLEDKLDDWKKSFHDWKKSFDNWKKPFL
jgi:hypothetical protein